MLHENFKNYNSGGQKAPEEESKTDEGMIDLSGMMQSDDQALKQLLLKAGAQEQGMQAGSTQGLSKKEKRLLKIQKQKEMAMGQKDQDGDEEVMDEDKADEKEHGDLGEEIGEGEGTGDPLTCLITFKKIVTDILDENELG